MSNTLPPIELSGVCYHGGKYDADYWLSLTGHDPRLNPAWFRISQTGLVVALPAYHDYCRRIRQQARDNWRCGLGVNA